MGGAGGQGTASGQGLARGEHRTCLLRRSAAASLSCLGLGLGFRGLGLGPGLSRVGRARVSVYRIRIWGES